MSEPSRHGDELLDDDIPPDEEEDEAELVISIPSSCESSIFKA